MTLSFALAHSLPELVLAVGALLLILLGAIRGHDAGGLITEIAIGVLGLAILIILLGTKHDAVIYNGAFVDDGFGHALQPLSRPRS